ncbi:flagellar biosynthesis anti-sigma factor FlgM [Amphritea japonica]|uniref:Negative regulator of flagellin synthesis n=1 Tax=Amphritea japonica ATCC BAA-1530 TaxID=1278309 RepID=A0A7R6SRD8_9GAMM|nr:flagellar biosynthesis anti-sigma factor FlgM [Amphritea japonica]BBB25139.1 negative regulator of flagellin synthesis FlgM [Amphritea japonica ATCC BAA-1530]
MVIDITGLSSTTQATNSRAKVSDQPAAESKAQKAPESGNLSSGVSLSDAAQAIQKNAEQLVDEGISVNEQKVAELKAAIDDGNYQIDYDSTARNLFQLESLLD